MSDQREIVIRKVIRSFSIILCDELIKSIECKQRRKRRVWVRDLLQQNSKEATGTIMKQPYVKDPSEYQTIMRLTPVKFEYLLKLIAPTIQRNDTFMREAIPARVKLEITLSFLASGMTFRMLSDFFRVSKASISKIIPEVCDAINGSLKDYIRVPSLEDWQVIQLEFNNRWNLPDCCGAIDGKHIVIKAPANSCSEYYNYKGCNSIVLLAIVDHNYCFKYIDIGTYGRNTKDEVLQNSVLYRLLENHSLLPEGGVLIGNDAFPLKSYLLKPTIEEKIYNCSLSSAKRIIENTFGIMASRFRIFGKPIEVQEQTAIKIIKTACILHNWLRMIIPNTYMPVGCIDYEDNTNFTVIQGQWRSEITELPSINSLQILKLKK